MQGRPEQQSASVVQVASVIWQPAAHRKPVSGLPMQGRPQQSALDAHCMPTWLCGSAHSMVQPGSFGAHAEMPQRGMPRLSCLHVSYWSTLPAQQFAFALHDPLWRRQIAPAGEQELPLSQRPTVNPGVIWHITFDSLSGCPGPPQQSSSFVQSSPVGRQPDGG